MIAIHNDYFSIFENLIRIILFLEILKLILHSYSNYNTPQYYRMQSRKMLKLKITLFYIFLSVNFQSRDGIHLDCGFTELIYKCGLLHWLLFVFLLLLVVVNNLIYYQQIPERNSCMTFKSNSEKR